MLLRLVFILMLLLAAPASAAGEGGLADSVAPALSKHLLCKTNQNEGSHAE